MPIIRFDGKGPQIGDDVFVMNSATLIGDLVLSRKVLVMPNVVMRADYNRIEVGERVVILENAVVNPVKEEPIIVRGESIIGYGAKIHGGDVGKGVFIGMNAVTLRGVKVGEHSVIAAGALLTQGMEVPPWSMVMGVPARVTRRVAGEEMEQIGRAIDRYMGMLQNLAAEQAHLDIRRGPDTSITSA